MPNNRSKEGDIFKYIQDLEINKNDVEVDLALKTNAIEESLRKISNLEKDLSFLRKSKENTKDIQVILISEYKRTIYLLKVIQETITKEKELVILNKKKIKDLKFALKMIDKEIELLNKDLTRVGKIVPFKDK
ncbi:MAG: hypothetical protein KGO96_07575 [Elusimicrobia bacterium]|nr:hypothetical protein [Elusimicrobiota bacterium]